MPKFIVFAKRTEILCAVIEADSAEKAEEAADNYYDNFDWSDISGSQNSEILYGNSIEEEEDE